MSWAQSQILTRKQENARAMWAVSLRLVLDAEPVIMRGREIAWKVRDTFMIRPHTKMSDDIRQQMNSVYAAVHDYGVPRKSGRWPKGPAVFYCNRAKHLGALGEHFKDRLIFEDTIVRVTVHDLTEEVTDGDPTQTYC